MTNQPTNNSLFTSTIIAAMTKSAMKIMYSSNPSAVSDIVGDALVKLIALVDNGREFTPEVLLPYAIRCARNEALNYLASSVNRGHVSSVVRDDSEVCAIDASSANPAKLGSMDSNDGRSTVESMAIGQWLVKAMDLLDATERAFILAIADGMGQCEAAKLVGWGKNVATRKRAEIAKRLATAEI